MVESTITGMDSTEHKIRTQMDSNWASDEDGRSTTGVRILVNGFKVAHISQPQPGLPSLSFGESELRSMTRASTESLFAQTVLAEVGIDASIKLETDASAACQPAARMSGGRMKHLCLADKFVRKLIKTKIMKLGKTGGQGEYFRYSYQVRGRDAHTTYARNGMARDYRGRETSDQGGRLGADE